jgi:hypothetical protein
MVRIALVVVVALAAVSCVEESPTSPGPLPVQRLTPAGFGQHSGLRESARLVVRDPDRFTQLWNEAWAGVQPPPPLPAVDFEREMVIVAVMGEQASGGFTIEVTGALDAGGEVKVGVRRSRPAPGCPVTLALTQPLDVVKLPRRASPVTFDEAEQVVDCK